MAYGVITGQSSSMDGVYETLDRNSMIRIPADADVNEYTTPGVYFVASDDKASVLNLPEFLYTRGYVSAFIVREGLYIGSQIIQEIYVNDSYTPARFVKKFIRGRGTTSAGWCDWIEIYSTYNKPTAADVGALPKTGGTINGNVEVRGDFIVESGVGSLSYLDLTPTSGTSVRVNGPLDMRNHIITNVVNPTDDNDAANKAYVDQQVVSAGGIVTGTYTGNGSTTGQTINLGFRPKAVIWGPASGISGVEGSSWGVEYYFVIDGITTGEPGPSFKGGAQIVSNGFMVHGTGDDTPNNNGTKYMYIAFK